MKKCHDQPFPQGKSWARFPSFLCPPFPPNRNLMFSSFVRCLDAPLLCSRSPELAVCSTLFFPAGRWFLYPENTQSPRVACPRSSTRPFDSLFFLTFSGPFCFQPWLVATFAFCTFFPFQGPPNFPPMRIFQGARPLPPFIRELSLRAF